MDILKPQTPLLVDNNYIFPITLTDQIQNSGGTRLGDALFTWEEIQASTNLTNELAGANGLHQIGSTMIDFLNRVGTAQRFVYSTTAAATGANHAMYTDGTISEDGIYLLYGVFVFPNTSIETNWLVAAESKEWEIAPVVRRISGSLRQTVTMFSISKIKKGSRLFMAGDGAVGVDPNYWAILAIRIS